MKYFKILLFILTFSSVSNAQTIRNMVFKEDSNQCIYNDYYYIPNGGNGGRFYYRVAGSTIFINNTTTKRFMYLHDGFMFDDVTLECRPDNYLVLGMDLKDFNFLLGLIGVLFGFAFLWFTIDAFIRVGGKR